MDFSSILNSYEFKETFALAIFFYFILRLFDAGFFDLLKAFFQFLIVIIKFLKFEIKKNIN